MGRVGLLLGCNLLLQLHLLGLVFPKLLLLLLEQLVIVLLLGVRLPPRRRVIMKWPISR